MTKIAVTRGSGKAGRAVVRGLLEHGHDVLNIDRVPSAQSDSPAPYLHADVTGSAGIPLSAEEIGRLEEPCVPHPVLGHE
jgi:nucleoside-diphosphate-sugar epimerase